MARSACPYWVGYLLLNPVRAFFENPNKMFANLIGEGQVVLEPGCGMGYFTLPLAHLVGPAGKVIAIDIEPRMIAGLQKRAAKAGVSGRIDSRLSGPGRLKVEDLHGKVDWAVVVHMLHETPDQGKFLEEIRPALKDGGGLVLIEPKWHVSRRDFKKSVILAQTLGFAPDERLFNLAENKALLRKAV